MHRRYILSTLRIKRAWIQIRVQRYKKYSEYANFREMEGGKGGRGRGNTNFLFYLHMSKKSCIFAAALDALQTKKLKEKQQSN